MNAHVETAGAGVAARTGPETHARSWAPGDVADVVGHEFHLEMAGLGSVPCRVVAAEPAHGRV